MNSTEPRLPKEKGNPVFRISTFEPVLFADFTYCGWHRASVTLEDRGGRILQWTEVIAHIRIARQRLALTNLVTGAMERLNQNYMATTRGLPPADLKVLACNLTEATSEFSKGALAYIHNNNPGWAGARMEIYGRSRSGRWILKWESIHRLGNFRFKTLAQALSSVAPVMIGQAQNSQCENCGRPNNNRSETCDGCGAPTSRGSKA